MVNQTQEEKSAICDREIARLRAEWEQASKHRLVLVRVSPRRAIVVQIAMTDRHHVDCTYFVGSQVYGPTTREMCREFIRKVIIGEITLTPKED